MAKRGRAWLLCLGLVAPAMAGAQQPGGVLQIAHRDSPASMSTLEEVTISTVAPMMAVFNNLVIFDQHVPQNTLQSIVPDLAESWSWNEDGTRADVPAARGRPLARRATVYRQGRPVHLGHAARQVGRQVPHQSAQELVLEPRSGHHQRRPRGDLSPEAAAAGLCRVARFRLFAGLSLPRAAAGDAPASDRHRPVQIRLVQAERVDPADPQPRLLEAGTALSRRHRMDDHPQPLDGAAGVCRGQGRHDLSVRGDRTAAEGHREPGARSDLRTAAARRRQHADRQSRRAAVRQPRSAAGDGADDRPQSLHRRAERRQGRHRRSNAAAARRIVGHAARAAARRCPATIPT